MQLFPALLSLLALVGCPGKDQPIEPSEEETAPDPPGETPDEDDEETEETPEIAPGPFACEELPALPVAFTTLPGFTRGEDFAFDADGYLVSVDENGNLVGINLDGERKVILPGVGEWTSGMHMLLGGDFVFNNAATGTLVRVTPEGGSTAVLSGLSYPNGIEVDLDGYVYVTEHDAGRIRRVDPDTGEYRIIAEGLYHPNGLQFSPDYQVLYVGSFGGGTVHAIDRVDDATWTEPWLRGAVPSARLDEIPDPCAGSAEGDACFRAEGGLGACQFSGKDELSCESWRDRAACEGLAEGDPCQSDLAGQSVISACTADPAGEGLFCPRADAARLAACEGQEHYDSCNYQGDPGTCVTSWEGALVCYIDADYDAWLGACEGQALGAACEVLDPASPFAGTCEDYSDWGWGVVCEPHQGFGMEAGLDGIAVDECENVYVTEYIAGVVWRFAPDGSEAEAVASTGAEWIPSMHWGNGVGGWQSHVLYVIERDRGVVHALEVGVLGVPEAYQPAE